MVHAQIESNHTSLRKKIEAAVALELYDQPVEMLKGYELADVLRFVDLNVMGYVSAYITRNYERITDENGRAIQ